MVFDNVLFLNSITFVDTFLVKKYVCFLNQIGFILKLFYRISLLLRRNEN